MDITKFNYKRISNLLKTIKSTKHGRVFLAVLLLKIAMLLSNTSLLRTEWFIPFIKNFVSSNYQSPWDSFLASGGFNKAFPYGTGMLISFTIPFSIKSLIFGLSDTVTRTDIFLMGIPIILADIGILSALIYPMRLDTKKSVYIYWCSPVVFYISYIHGQLDIVPMMFMLASIAFLINEHILLSGLILGFGLSTKANLFISLPFLAIYVLRKEGSWGRVLRYILYILGVYVLLTGPFFFSSGYQYMVIGAEERTWVFLLYIAFSRFKIFLAPLAISLLYIKFSTYRTLNKEILIMYIGLAFTLLVLLIPVDAPGWYMWIVPFLCYYYINSNKFHLFPLLLFYTLFIVFFLTQSPYPVHIIDPHSSPPILTFFKMHMKEAHITIFINLVFTFIEGVILYFSVTMYIYGVRANKIYKEAESVTIGIGGDSGSGKDTLCDLLRKVLGEKNVLQVNGDDTHRWKRGDKKWDSYTHLDPKANDLFLQINHTKSLLNGMPISRRFYDHDTGDFSGFNVMRPRKYIFVSGLHPFYIRNMRSLIDIKIYIDTEKSLRTLWKIQRDMKHRGYDAEKVIKSIESRKGDGLKYIKPQKDYADMVIRYECVDKIDMKETEEPKIRVNFTIDNSVNLENLVSELEEFPSLKTKHWYADFDKQFLLVEGSVSSGIIREIACRTIHNLYELVGPNLYFEDDLKGIVQIVFLCVLNNYKLNEEALR